MSANALHSADRFNLLRRARQADVVLDPFPHLVIENALEEGAYTLLEATFPSEKIIRSAKQVANRDQLQAYEGISHPGVDSVWSAFMRWHSSPQFYRQWVSLFAPWIREFYPWLEEEVGRPLEDFEAGVRDPTAAALPSVCLDCQPGLNTVSLDPVSYRSSHLDAPNKLLTGLFYMRLPGDDSKGGDLLLQRVRNPPPTFESPTTVPETQLDGIHFIPYARNTAVFFLNSPRSFHAVTVREGTVVPRRLVNLVAGLYSLSRGGLYPSPPLPESYSGQSFVATPPA